MAPPSNRNANCLAHLKEQSLLKKTLKTASKSTHKQQQKPAKSIPHSNEQRPRSVTKKQNKKQTRTKASSHEGQCIPAGSSVSLPRMVLITMSIITMRSRPFPAKSASDCLRFAKPRPQFSNLVAPSTDGSAKCLLLYRSASGPLTNSENSVQIDA